MRRGKGSRRIVVGGIEYRWRAKGDDGYISIGIWPSNNVGPYIRGNLGYHETWVEIGDGVLSSARNQIVITGRLIQRVIEHVIAEHRYNPEVKGAELNLKVMDDIIKWEDAVRAGDHAEKLTAQEE